jgi:hypothetical protein
MRRTISGLDMGALFGEDTPVSTAGLQRVTFRKKQIPTLRHAPAKMRRERKSAGLRSG